MSPYVITFRSITAAQRGERILQKNGIRCQISRTPRWMEEQGCGYCLKLGRSRIREAVAMLEENGIHYRKLYLLKTGTDAEEVVL